MQNRHFQLTTNPFNNSSIKPFADIIYKKICKQIPSINEMSQIYSNKRPESEVVIIYSIINECIHVDTKGRESVIYLIDPIKNQPGVLLKMIRGGINYVIDEGTPFIVKGFGTASFSFGAQASVKIEWARYLNKLNNRPDKLWRSASSLRYGKTVSGITKASGKILNGIGVAMDLLGTAMIYYDVISRDSPSLITPDRIIEATKKEISRLCQN